MDRQERAELAVRVAGLAVLVLGGVEAVLMACVYLLAGGNGSGGGTSFLVRALAPLVVMALVGAVLLIRPGAVSRLLVPVVPEGEDSPLGELLRLGMFALAAWFLMGALAGVAQGASGLPLQYIPAMACVLLVGACLAPPRLLTAWLGAQTRAGEGWSPAGAIAMGFALFALWGLGQRLVELAELPALGASLARVSDWSAAQRHALVAQNLAGSGIGVALALLLLAFCGPLGRRLARGAPQGPRPVLSALSKVAWIELAFLASVLMGIFLQLRTGADLLGVAITNLGAWLQLRLEGAFLQMDSTNMRWLILTTPLIVLGVLVAAARLGSVLGRALYRESAGERPDEQAERQSLVIVVEVAMTAIVVDRFAGSVLYGGYDVCVKVAWFLTVALLLALRGDVARWCVRPGGTAEDLRERREAARPRLEAALYPWLSLVGVALVLPATRILFLHALVEAGLVPQWRFEELSTARGLIDAPAVAQLGVGLVLILARRPLARLLAYGPLLHGNGDIRHGLTSD